MNWQARLIEALEEKRGERTIHAQAQEIGMHDITLRRIITGERGIGGEALTQILAAYPDLGRVFLPTDSPDGRNTETERLQPA